MGQSSPLKSVLWDCVRHDDDKFYDGIIARMSYDKSEGDKPELQKKQDVIHGRLSIGSRYHNKIQIDKVRNARHLLKPC